MLVSAEFRVSGWLNVSKCGGSSNRAVVDARALRELAFPDANVGEDVTVY